MTLPKVDKQASLQEQVAQMQSQIYQLKEQIEWLMAIQNDQTTKEVAEVKTGLEDFVQSSVVQNGEFKSLINQTAAKITAKIEGLDETVAKIEVTSTKIEAEVFDEEGNSKISQMASEIDLKVDQGGCIADINITPGEVKIEADKIDLNGYTTVNGNFHITEDGDMAIETDTIKVLVGGSLDVAGISGAEGLVVARVDANGNIISSKMMWYSDDGLVDNTGAYILQHTPSSRNWSGFVPGKTSIGQGDTVLSLSGYNERPLYNQKELALLNDLAYRLEEKRTSNYGTYYALDKSQSGNANNIPTVDWVINYIATH